uniref:cGMP-dependent protein kinase n=1 Tax=Haptolina ericina TaxID=156174 RepID=A0A7S3ASZ5_9EUKA
MDLFDRALGMSSDQMGEEMDAVTKEAFIEVALDANLIPRDEFAFVSPIEIGKVTKLDQVVGKAKTGSKQKGRTVAAAPPPESGADNDGDDPKVSVKDTREKQIISDAVRTNFLFRHLDDTMLETVTSYMTPRTVEQGEAVITQGDRGDFFYVIESGVFHVMVNGAHVHTYEVDEEQRVYPTFGELALMYAKPRAASVVANTRGKLWKLGRSGFRQVQTLASTAVTDPTKLLRKVEIFSALRYDQLLGLRDAMETRSFVPDEYVFNQGDAADGFYILTEGAAQVVKTEEGVEAEIMSLTAPSYFGERALLYSEPRAAGVKATSKLTSLFISREQFEQQLGPLADVIEQDRRDREAKAEVAAKQLEAFGLAAASRESFGFEAIVSSLPCGAVHLARHMTTDKLYLVRQELKSSLVERNEQERIPREIKILNQINEKGIHCASLPTLLRIFQSDSSVFHLFRKVAVCDLSQFCEAGALAGDERLRFAAACITQALLALHSELQLLYRNVSIDQLYVLEDGYVSLLNFQFAKFDDGSCRTMCGPVCSVAPETLRGESQTSAIDWWSFGTALFEMVTGDSPWGSSEGEDTVLLKNISAHTFGAIEVPEASTDCAKLINALLHPKPSERLQGPAVQNHPWFAQVSWKRLRAAELPSPCADSAQEFLNRLTLEAEDGGELSGKPLARGGPTGWLTDFDSC